LNTAQKNNASFFIFLAHMCGAHGFEGEPFTGNDLHPADTAASSAAAVSKRSLPVMEHFCKDSFILAAGKIYTGILYGNRMASGHLSAFPGLRALLGKFIGHVDNHVFLSADHAALPQFHQYVPRGKAEFFRGPACVQEEA